MLVHSRAHTPSKKLIFFAVPILQLTSAVWRSTASLAPNANRRHTAMAIAYVLQSRTNDARKRLERNYRND